METNGEGLRQGLLSRLPQPANAAEYRREVNALLERNDKGLKREKIGTALIWCWAVLFFILAIEAPNLWHGGQYMGTLKGIWVSLQMGLFALFLTIYGAVELLKHFINRTRVELLKEAKQIQLQVLELQEALLRK